MELSNCVYYFHVAFTISGKMLIEKLVRDEMGLLAFITSCRERLSASETQVYQTVRQLHRGNKGQREGEAGMNPLDQLIGQPETEEQLRKLVTLFSEVQRWGPKVHKIEFLFHRSGVFLSFFHQQ